MKNLILAIILSFTLFSISAYAEELTVKAKRAVVCERIEDREPANETDSFSAGSKASYFTEITTTNPPTSIQHVWYFHKDDKIFEMARINLRIGGTRWRTWSTKTLYTAGKWSVEAIDESGEVLSTHEIMVTEK